MKLNTISEAVSGHQYTGPYRFGGNTLRFRLEICKRTIPALPLTAGRVEVQEVLILAIPPYQRLDQAQ